MSEHYQPYRGEYYCKVLKPVNGCSIEKSAELNSRTGKIKPGTVVYSVFTDDSIDAGLVDCFKTLKEARECAKSR